MPDHFDRIIKENLAELAPGLIRLMTGFEFEDERPLHPELSATPSAVPDFVHFIRTKEGERAILHIEFQRNMDNKFTSRMLLYQGLLRNNYHELTTYQYVVYIGEKNHSIPPYYEHPRGWRFEYDLVNLKELDFERFLASDKPEEVLFAVFADVPVQLQSDVVKRLIQKLRILTEKAGTFGKFLIQLNTLSRLNKKIAPILKQEIKKAMPLTFTPEEKKEMLETSFFYEDIVEEGKAEEKKETARKMLEKGYAVNDIAEMTGLPLEEIKRIQQGLKS